MGQGGHNSAHCKYRAEMSMAARSWLFPQVEPQQTFNDTCMSSCLTFTTRGVFVGGSLDFELSCSTPQNHRGLSHPAGLFLLLLEDFVLLFEDRSWRSSARES